MVVVGAGNYSQGSAAAAGGVLAVAVVLAQSVLGVFFQLVLLLAQSVVVSVVYNWLYDC